MARGGIYKAEVIRARDNLVARGMQPTIDAIRAELGNTGSKSTIHRYLKEIEEEEESRASTKSVAVGDAIEDLVARLAARLHEEADTRIAEAAEKQAAECEKLRSELAAMKEEAEGFREQLQRSQLALAEEQRLHAETAAKLRTETVERAKLAQQTLDLLERVKAEEAHRVSLEEKHQHAREALEHFRQATKEQREQEARQHEQQTQYLQGEIRALNQTLTQRQHEAIQANQDNARLTTELARSEAALREAKAELRTLKDVQAALTSVQQHADELGRRLVERDATIGRLTEEKHQLTTQLADQAQAIRQLEINLAASTAAAAAQGEIAEKIQAFLKQPPSQTSAQS